MITLISHGWLCNNATKTYTKYQQFLKFQAIFSWLRDLKIHCDNTYNLILNQARGVGYIWDFISLHQCPVDLHLDWIVFCKRNCHSSILKQKCHFNEISVTVCTESCRNDNFNQCSQCRIFVEMSDTSVLVYEWILEDEIPLTASILFEQHID